MGVTDVCETELACGDVEGWRLGMDVGGQKGVVFICSLGGFVGQGVGTKGQDLDSGRNTRP